MKQLYDQLSFHISKATTKKYSTSFSLGIATLAKELREPIYAIYGFVRIADEIVDSFHGYDKENLMTQMRRDTVQAISQRISINPILHAFQETYHKYGIPWELVDTFLQSMEMDLEDIEYDSEKYKQYILGSAEVVGLMCLKVFVYGDEAEYQKLKPYAMMLGSAFQKINFLRDLKDDYHILGRTYFPNVEMSEFNAETKKALEKEVEAEFEAALEGIRLLPKSSRLGVYLAYTYYRSLLNKIKRTPPQTIVQERVRINNGKKFSLMMRSYVKVKMAML
jgi:phytoene/squalene synthetase